MALKTNPTLLAGFLVHKEMSLKALIESNCEDNLFWNLGKYNYSCVMVLIGYPASDIELMLEL